MKFLVSFLTMTPILFACKTESKYEPEHNPQSCTFISDLEDSDQYSCGQIIVPENHDDPEGRKITISYVRIFSTIENPSYPMIYFTGGPGGAALSAEDVLGTLDYPVRNNHDIILFDQRGIGYSSGIPNLEEAMFFTMQQDITSEEEIILMDSIMTSYKQLIDEEGIQLQYYNSFQNARDVGVLMEALGYEKYNLYGGSYGTRIARVVQDYFPQKINASFLNSPSPLGDDFLAGRLRAYSKALDRVFEYCENSEVCNKQYPEIRDRYFEVIQKLEEDPLHLEVFDKKFVVNPQDALYLIRRKLYHDDSRMAIPEMIMEFHRREPNIIRDVIENEFIFSDGYNSSMWIAVERYEMFDPKYTEEVINELYDSLDLFPVKLGIFNSLYFVGKNWHSSSLPLDERIFQASDVPTMITVNQYDPVTPPSNGPIMMKGLTNGRLYVLDEGGHGGGNRACRIQVMMDFFANPDDEPDVSCLNLWAQN